MKKFRADLHIHTVLSPCGDLEMSPDVIMTRAKEMELDIIGITDHNSMRQCSVIKESGIRNGIVVLAGVEITTKEEVHCLAFFETVEQADDFQRYLDGNLPEIKNDVNRFGYQVVVDGENSIVYCEEKLLISALNQSIEQVETKVHSLHGLFIPAHIDKKRFSIMEQLGFLPKGLQVDALELSHRCTKESFLRQHPEMSAYSFVSGSDAHYPEEVGRKITIFEMKHPGFDEIRMALGQKNGRKTEVLN